MRRIDNDLPMAQTRLALVEYLLDDIRDGQYAIIDREMDIIVHIGHTILLLSALVVMRTGVEFEHLIESLELALTEKVMKAVGNYHGQTADGVGVGKSTFSLRVAVGIRYVGFDVVYRRAIHQVGAHHRNHRPTGSVGLYSADAYRRQAQSIGTERRTCGKDSHLLIAAQQRRSHNERGGGMLVGRKAPNQPKIIKLVKTTQRVGIAILWTKDY